MFAGLLSRNSEAEHSEQQEISRIFRYLPLGKDKTIFENIHAEYTFICSIELSALFDKPRSSSSAEEIVRAMAPKASSNTIVRAIGPSHTSGNKMGPNQIGHNEMGPSDTINDIAALAALSDLDQDERIEKVKKYSIRCIQILANSTMLSFHFRPGTLEQAEKENIL